MRSIKSILLCLVLAPVLSSCIGSKWKAQTCDTKTMTCSKMSYGPYETLDSCIDSMKKLGMKFTCAKGCKDNDAMTCKGEIMRYNVKIEGGNTKVIPISN